MMNETSIGKMFSEVKKLIRLYLTVPMTSATAEHTFLTLYQLKNYLQSTVTRARLNHFMVLHTHKDSTDNINVLEIAKEFVSFSNR